MRAILIIDDDSSALADLLAQLTAQCQALPIAAPMEVACTETSPPASQPHLLALLRRHGLTPRECEVVLLDFQGFSRLEIAQRLTVVSETVTKYWASIYDKLAIQRRSQLRQWISAQAGPPAHMPPEQ